MGFVRSLFGNHQRQAPKDESLALSKPEIGSQSIMRLQDNAGFAVEYELMQLKYPVAAAHGVERKRIQEGLNEVDARLNATEAKIGELNKDIERLTNNADALDYTVAVASGILTGLSDVFFVGETNIQESHNWGNKQLEAFVKRLGGSDDLEKAVSNLEKKSKAFFPSDPNLNDFGGGLQHHLRDFAHHPTIAGLAFSLLTQFTGMCYGTDTSGAFITVPVKDVSRIGDTLPEKVLYGTAYWFLHLVSDMVGTSITAGCGTGLPGPIVSLAKELSGLPFFRGLKVGSIDASAVISKVFNGTLFAEYDSSGRIIRESVVPFDLRTELGALRKQTIPVMLNELIVRIFYAARRFGQELDKKRIDSLNGLDNVDWERVAPMKNRTIARMLTIATGTFVAVDMADAAIHATAKTGGAAPAWAASFVLRVNFVGLGRFAIALGTDIGMGVKRRRLESEQIRLYMEQIHLCDAKVFYKQADMWISAAETGEALLDAYHATAEVISLFYVSLQETQEALESIDARAVRRHNKGLIEDMLDELE